jgi:hypothetical protein
MDRDSIAPLRPWLLAASLVLAAWSVAGLIQRPSVGRGGFMYRLNYVVEVVTPGGVADQAGLKPGDRLISMDGRPIERLPMQSRWPRTRVGETRHFVVERDGQTVNVDIVFGPPSHESDALRLIAAIVALGFLGFGLWAVYAAPSPPALLLALLGLAAFGAVSATSVDLGGLWNAVPEHVQLACAVLWPLLFQRFFLVFPKPKRVGVSRPAEWAMLGTMLLFLALLVLEPFVHPRLYRATWPLGSLLMLGYLVLALVALTHTAVTTTRSERRESGVGLVLVGFLVAVAATLAPVATEMLAPGVHVPGLRYLPVLIVAIPCTMALAVRRHAGGSRAQAG